jgi:hypothetical protein
LQPDAELTRPSIDAFTLPFVEPGSSCPNELSGQPKPARREAAAGGTRRASAVGGELTDRTLVGDHVRALI